MARQDLSSPLVGRLLPLAYPLLVVPLSVKVNPEGDSPAVPIRGYTYLPPADSFIRLYSNVEVIVLGLDVKDNIDLVYKEVV